MGEISRRARKRSEGISLRYPTNHFAGHPSGEETEMTGNTVVSNPLHQLRATLANNNKKALAVLVCIAIAFAYVGTEAVNVAGAKPWSDHSILKYVAALAALSVVVGIFRPSIVAVGTCVTVGAAFGCLSVGPFMAVFHSANPAIVASLLVCVIVGIVAGAILFAVNKRGPVVRANAMLALLALSVYVAGSIIDPADEYVVFESATGDRVWTGFSPLFFQRADEISAAYQVRPATIPDIPASVNIIVHQRSAWTSKSKVVIPDSEYGGKVLIRGLIPSTIQEYDRIGVLASQGIQLEVKAESLRDSDVLPAVIAEFFDKTGLPLGNKNVEKIVPR
jgi:hypothetical protein